VFVKDRADVMLNDSDRTGSALQASAREHSRSLRNVGLFVAGAVVVVAGLLLPWERSGRRSSFELFATVDRIGFVDVPGLAFVVTLLPFVPMVFAGAAVAGFTGHVVVFRAVGGAVTVGVGVVAVAMWNTAGAVTAGPVVTCVGAAVTATALCVPSSQRDPSAPQT
jgi:hypothetical protein